jgi:hypothetical protein
LLYDNVAAMLIETGICHRTEADMGDKSPKSKQRQQKQKSAVKQQHAADAKTKQTPQAIAGKDKK